MNATNTKRIWGLRSTRAMAQGLLLLLCGAGVAGCEEPLAANLAVGGNVVPERQGTLGCTLIQATQFYTEGVLDLSMTDEYFFNADVNNRLPNSTQINNNGAAQLRPDYNLVTLKRATVSVSIPSRSTGNAVQSPFKGQSPVTSRISGGPRPQQVITSWSVPVSGSIIAGNTFVTSFPLIPRAINGVQPVGWDWKMRFKDFVSKNNVNYSYAERVMLTFEIEGETAGGATMVSGTISYPLTVCWGCLLSVPTISPNLDGADDVWRVCSENPGVPAGAILPCRVGNNDEVPCNVLCADCLLRESAGEDGACDPKFCPEL